MIKNYLIMKKNEWKLKGMVYSIIATLIDNQKNALEIIKKTYISLKDIPIEELQKEFVNKLAEFVYNENKNITK